MFVVEVRKTEVGYELAAYATEAKFVPEADRILSIIDRAIRPKSKRK
jgi:hypothetical protein